MLVYLADSDRLPFLDSIDDPTITRKKAFQRVKAAKKKLGAAELCGDKRDDTPAHLLKEFVEEVLSLEYQEVPDYEKLKFLLEKSILGLGHQPVDNYDFFKDEIKFKKK